MTTACQSTVEAAQGLDCAAVAEDLARRARAASRRIAVCPTDIKNRALMAMAAAIRANKAEIQSENRKDLDAAAAAGLAPAMIDRLRLSEKGVEGMAVAVEEIAALPDPVGEITDVRRRAAGLQVGQMRAPIGVVAIIYESRPNVTADAGALCLKSGNAVILRGGKEAIHSNAVIARIMNEAGTQAGLPADALQLVPTTDRAAVTALLQLNQYIDVVIPRGGKGLIEAVMQSARMPVIKHLDGNCFVYVDRDADAAMAERIVMNSKTQRTGVCNAAESLLIHKDVAATVGVDLVRKLVAAGVEIRADLGIRALVSNLKEATEADWDEEYLDMIMTAGVVDSTEAAIDFINAHGSHHTDAIVTEHYPTAMQFLAGVDSACVFINCSTRFSDGGQFGMGAEIGISTDKLHARGPMGLRELTTLKFVAFGEGQIRT